MRVVIKDSFLVFGGLGCLQHEVVLQHIFLSFFVDFAAHKLPHVFGHKGVADCDSIKLPRDFLFRGRKGLRRQFRGRRKLSRFVEENAVAS